MFNRLKRLWALSKKDTKLLDQLTPEDIAKLPDAPNGKAEFLPEATQEDFEDFKKEQTGLKAWYTRIKNLD